MQLLSTLILVATSTLQPAASPSQPAVKEAAPKAEGPYHVLRTFELGGEGGWDCIKIDSDAHRLYVPHATRVMVIDTETGKTVGEVADTSGVHDVALASALGKGFTSSGKTDDVTVFDLKTLKAITTVKAGKNPDGMVYEPATKRIFCFNGRGNDATVISAEDLTVVGTVAVGGKPELADVDGAGNVWVNVEDTSEVIRIDAKTLKVEQRISLAPGSEPTGLAIDTAHHRLFSACHNEMMTVVDIQTGKVIATPAIGKGVDGAAFDPAGFAISSNGEGTISVIDTSSAKPFAVIQTLPTAKSARTIVLDPKTRRMYLPAAEYEPQTQEEKDAKKRPKMKAGSFKIVVVGP